MKKKIVFIIVGLLSWIASGQNELLFSQANEAYNKGDYQKAIELYKKIEETGNISSNLYFNIANSYYKLQQVAPSIYNYEKALALKPNDSDVLNNYEFAKNMRVDQIDFIPEGFLTKAYKYLVTLFTTDTWAWIAVVFIFLFVICFVLFYRTAEPTLRKLFFGLWSLSAFLALFSFIFAFQAQSFKNNNVFGIVYAKEVNIQGEPNLRSETLFKLHEGTKVQIMDNVDNWNKIKLTDGKIGWMPDKEVKKI